MVTTISGPHGGGDGGCMMLTLFVRLRLSFHYNLEQMTEYDANDIAEEEQMMMAKKVKSDNAAAQKSAAGFALRQLKPLLFATPLYCIAQLPDKKIHRSCYTTTMLVLPHDALQSRVTRHTACRSFN
jgi:hypothetical protein